MSETYSRVGSLLIGKETTANAAVTPSVSLPINDEGLAENYSSTPSTPVQGNRAMNLRTIKSKITAPVGSLNLNVEPKTFGYILEGLRSLTSGTYFALDGTGGDLAVADTITNGSTGTGTVAAIITEENIVIATGVSGDWATGDTVTNGGTHSSTLGTFDATVYAHLAQMPADLGSTYTIQRNLSDRAQRYMGVRFHAIDGFAQSDNVITAGVQAMAQSSFRHAKVEAAVTAAAGTVTITLDQTQGLVTGDSIKVWRPSTGAFLDFPAASTEEHTIDTIVADTSIDVTNLQTDLAEGDLIVLAPITPSYSIEDEFAWIGCSTASLGDDKDNLTSFDCQDFGMTAVYEVEERHAAGGTGIASRFPSDILQKGYTAEGSFTLHNEDEEYYRHHRVNNAQAIKLATNSGEIGTTGINYQLLVTYSNIQFNAYDINLTQDEILNEEVPFTSFYGEDAGFSTQIILINDVASY